MLRIFSSSLEQASVWMAETLLSVLDCSSYPNTPLSLPLLTLPLPGGGVSPLPLAGKGLEICGSCTSWGAACAWREMFEEGNWSEVHPPLICTQEENNSAPLTMEIWAFRVFAVWAAETGEPMLPVAYVAADTTCVVSFLEIPWIAFSWVCAVLLLESEKHGKPIGWAGSILPQKARGLINDNPLGRVSQTCSMMCFIRKSWMWIIKQSYIPVGCEGNKQMLVA